MIKRTLLLISAVSLVLAGCSSDQRYKREAESNFDYLNTQALIPLVVPEGITLPASTSTYYIFQASKEGAVGKNVDIRPPALPIPTMIDTYAVYNNGKIVLDQVSTISFWESLPTILQGKNISVAKSGGDELTTGTVSTFDLDESVPFEATYDILREISGDREYITIQLVSLKQQGQDVTDTLSRQRYTVSFFNSLMDEVAKKRAVAPTN